MTRLVNTASFVYRNGFLPLGEEMFFDIKHARKLRITPNLFIVGAQKCGTSSLHNYLSEHPDIYMSKPLKEPGYYLPWEVISEYYRKKGRTYEDRSDLLVNGMMQGFKGEKWFGESSTFYSNGTYNLTKAQFEKNNMDINEVRVIYLMKHPIKRIVSHFLHAIRNNNFEGNINDFILSNKEAVGISLYSAHLSGYLSFLRKGQVCLIRFEDFIVNPQKTMNSVYEFLDVQPISHSSFGVYNPAPSGQNRDETFATIDPTILSDLVDRFQKDADELKMLAGVDNLKWV